MLDLEVNGQTAGFVEAKHLAPVRSVLLVRQTNTVTGDGQRTRLLTATAYRTRLLAQSPGNTVRCSTPRDHTRPAVGRDRTTKRRSRGKHQPADAAGPPHCGRQRALAGQSDEIGDAA